MSIVAHINPPPRPQEGWDGKLVSFAEDWHDFLSWASRLDEPSNQDLFVADATQILPGSIGVIPRADYSNVIAGFGDLFHEVVEKVAVVSSVGIDHGIYATGSKSIGEFFMNPSLMCFVIP